MPSEHQLDRPVWASLTTTQSAFSQGSDNAKRYHPEIGPLAAIRDEGEQSIQALAELLQHTRSLAVPQAYEFPIPKNASVVGIEPVLQMIYEGSGFPTFSMDKIEPLQATDAINIYNLAKKTNPGPFEKRTHELGQFWGIKDGDKLVAMAGERMKTSDFVEISGVCTDPDHEGRGYGKALCMHMCNLVLSAEKQPFLHVFETNSRAISIYQSLGFVPRATMLLTILKLKSETGV